MQKSGSSLTYLRGYHEDGNYEEDKDSSLKLLGNRYYDPSVGRFLTPDPAGVGSNWYAYCGNNPLSEEDPTGLAKRDIFGDGAGDDAYDSSAGDGGHWTGGYGDGVGRFLHGYVDVINPVMWVKGCLGVANIGWNQGPLAALEAVGGGFAHGYSDWLAADDPRDMGRSVGTMLLPCLGLTSELSEVPEKPCFGNRYAGGPIDRDPTGTVLADAEAGGRPHTRLSATISRDGTRYAQRYEFGEAGQLLARWDFYHHGRFDHPAIHSHNWIPKVGGSGWSDMIAPQ